MSWIREINESEAEGVLGKTYSRVRKERGKVSNVMRALSLDPRAMEVHLDLYLALMFRCGGGVTREERELIGTVVSAVNNCEYCARHHAAALNYYWKDESAVRRLVEDHAASELPARSRAILDYAVKVTGSPHEVAEGDIERLREVGLSDEDILQVNMITAYFNFVNRIVLGLGVEFTEEEMAEYRY